MATQLRSMKSLSKHLASRRWFSATAAAPKKFDKILIANRGEIACRVIKSAKKAGIKTVAIYSEPDKHSQHVLMADEAICVGPAESSLSYLNVPAIMDAIKSTGAQAVHPGYGFLSENSSFSGLLEQNGIEFIGPKKYAIESMGDKITSKQIARDANVNTIPGWLGTVEKDEDVIKVAQEIGYPVMIKASAGGGGKGMRVAYDDAEAVEGFRLSRQEAMASFGDDTIFLEKFIEEPRHIEIQLLADRHGNAIWLNERECSIQRRNQKVIEEAPSVVLNAETRKAMGEQAVALAKAVQYESAGTVEFLLDKHNNFFFLEMNTRLQVEHPVTELITGVDLVEQMIKVAEGHPLDYKQEDISINGWAIESRVYAEDPLRGFLPSIGKLDKYVEPEGEGVRCDSGIAEGSEISMFYDPMICKLVTYGEDREQAIARMKTALDQYVIRGVTHNCNFLRDLCEHPRFVKGELTTAFIPEEFPDGYHGHVLKEDEVYALAAGSLLVHLRMLLGQSSISDQNDSYVIENEIDRKLDVMKVTITCDTQEPMVKHFRLIDLSMDGDGETPSLMVQSDEGKLMNLSGKFVRGEPVFTAIVNEQEHFLQVLKATDSSNTYTVQHVGSQYEVKFETMREAELEALMPVKEVIDLAKVLVSPMPGAVVSFDVKVGDEVVEGQEVCVIEAMKMQNVLRATGTGKVKAVHVKPGQAVAVDEVMMELE